MHAKRAARQALLAALGFTCVLALGCALVRVLRGPSRPSFSHARHVVEKKMECSDCHADYETEDRAGMPVPEICQPCHGEKDKEKPPHLRADAFLKDGEPVWSSYTELGDEVIFSHRVHHEKGVACAECHGAIDTSVQVTRAARIGKPECMDCHARRRISNECATCHRSIRQDIAPPDHLLAWQERHGQAVRSGRQALDLCNLCHTENQCFSCHQEVPPRSHTNFWRQRGHGVAVDIDRESCRTCHRVDFCDRCHREVEPRSHIASFGAPTHRHCLDCHSPLQAGQDCGVCHRGTPGHATADPMPPWHTPAMNCRQCHVAGPSLPHVDNGDNCTGCHR